MLENSKAYSGIGVRDVEAEAHVLRHPGFARLELAADDDLHHAAQRRRIPLGFFEDALERSVVEAALGDQVLLDQEGANDNEGDFTAFE